MWGGLFSTFDCAVKGFRKKEDPWNASMCSLPLEEKHHERKANGIIVGAGFLTGGSLAIRGGFKAARNSAIGCAILLAVIEGVGIGIQRMMAENTRLDVRTFCFPSPFELFVLTRKIGTSTSAGCRFATSSSGLAESDGRLISFALMFERYSTLPDLAISKTFGISEESCTLSTEYSYGGDCIIRQIRLQNGSTRLLKIDTE